MPETPDSPVQLSPDLNRALAEAMSENHSGTIGVSPRDSAAAPDRSMLLRWKAPNAGQHSGPTVVGIDYSLSQITMLEMGRSRHPSILGLQSVRFEISPSSEELASLLRAFSPGRRNRVQVTLTCARAVVRQFNLPPVSKRRRRAAAIWEAQKLIPFPLKESEAVFGLTFAPSPRKGWQVTLAAVPREDAYPILEAIQQADWTLEGVSIAGTHWIATDRHSKSSEPAATVATVLWSAMRASFVIFHHHDLRFHYDLGPLPLPEVPPGSIGSPELLQRWLGTVEKGIGEALEFYIGAYPDLTVDRIDLLGLDEAVAPLVTDWQERFGVPVTMVNPVSNFVGDLPSEISEWIISRSPAITTAIAAAVGAPTVDMTPAVLVKNRSRRKSERIARTVFLSSVFAAMIWTGFLWMQQSLAARSAGRMRTQLQELKLSPANNQLQQVALQLEQVNSIEAAVAVSGIHWTPYFKAILETFPAEARLTSLSAAPPQGVPPGSPGLPMMRLDGKLLPAERSHTLIYADWFGGMERVAGRGSVNLVSDRTIDWKGRQTSVFSIELTPTIDAEVQAP